MTWRAYFLETASGHLGPMLDPVGGSWSIPLNQVEDCSVTVRKSQLKDIDRHWRNPWEGGVLFTFTHQGIEYPWVAGPIIDYPTETLGEMQYTFNGIRKIFEKRFVIEEALNAVALKIFYDKLSLGAIAQEVVKKATNKTGGALPITFASPYETFTSGGHQRTYEGFNLANLRADDVLTKLSEVIGGPDIMFRPQWADEGRTRITWAMHHGTEDSPPISQQWIPDFDTTSARSNLSGVSVKSAGSKMVDRVWATGSGDGFGTASARYEDLTLVNQGKPLLEETLSDPDQGKSAVLMEKAQGAVRENLRMISQVSVSARANENKAALGTYFVGDLGNVTLSGWESLPDGTRPMRIISMSGNLTNTVGLEFQEDSF